jgi:peptidoglycan lytic transglycosylase
MIARVSTSLSCAVLALAVVPAARAQSPGGAAAPVMAPVAQAVTAGSGRLTVSALRDQMLGQIARFTGSAPAGRLVRLQRLDATTRRWRSIARARAGAGAAFVAHWRPDHIGRMTLRAALRGAVAPLAVTVYKPALATWYGPGFFGKQTACGMPLTPDLQGLAHRTLPCGTQVAIAYGGRSVVLPVIDRGPFGVAGAEWDLTQAAAMTLGISATARLGAVRLRDQPAAAASK